MSRGPGRAAAVAAVVLAAGLATGCTQPAVGADGPLPAPTPSVAATGSRTPSAPSPSSAQPSSAQPSSGRVPAGTQVTLAASGDVLVHYDVQEDARRSSGSGRGYDFRPMFAQMRPQVQAADVAICHQETPISADNTALTRSGTLVFNAPREIAAAVRWAGFDGCDTASNHSWDRGVGGIADTVSVLRAAGLKQTGPGPNAKTTGRPAFYEAKGVRIANLGYTYTIVNDGSPNKTVPAEASWLGKVLWPRAGVEGITRDAKAARASGADLVVASIHWGQQYQREPTAEQVRVATSLLSSGSVDLILGDHVHVVQPCQKVNGRYVLYGMGNFLSNQAPSQASGLTPSNQDGTLNVVTFTSNGDGTFEQSLEVQPTFVRLRGHVIERATHAQHPRSLQRTTKALRSLGPEACDATILDD